MRGTLARRPLPPGPRSHSPKRHAVSREGASRSSALMGPQAVAGWCPCRRPRPSSSRARPPSHARDAISGARRRYRSTCATRSGRVAEIGLDLEDRKHAPPGVKRQTIDHARARPRSSTRLRRPRPSRPARLSRSASCSCSAECRAFTSRSRSPPRHDGTRVEPDLEDARDGPNVSRTAARRCAPARSCETVDCEIRARRARSSCRSRRWIRTARNKSAKLRDRSRRWQAAIDPQPRSKAVRNRATPPASSSDDPHGATRSWPPRTPPITPRSLERTPRSPGRLPGRSAGGQGRHHVSDCGRCPARGWRTVRRTGERSQGRARARSAVQGRLRVGVCRARAWPPSPPLHARVPVDRRPRDRRGRRPGDVPGRLPLNREGRSAALAEPLAQHDRPAHRRARGLTRAFARGLVARPAHRALVADRRRRRAGRR